MTLQAIEENADGWGQEEVGVGTTSVQIKWIDGSSLSPSLFAVIVWREAIRYLLRGKEAKVTLPVVQSLPSRLATIVYLVHVTHIANISAVIFTQTQQKTSKPPQPRIDTPR